jgi:hypothetical protein
MLKPIMLRPFGRRADRLIAFELVIVGHCSNLSSSTAHWLAPAGET